MKRHVQNAGTKKWFGDYLVELESEPLKAIDKMASAYDGCMITGGLLTLVSGTTYNVSAGLVSLKIDGEYKVAPLPATSNVDVSVQKAIRIVKTAVTGQYQIPVDLTIAYNYTAEVINYVAGLGTLNQDYLLIPTNGGAIRSYRDAIQSSLYRFVTDTEKNTWNSKAAGTHTHAATDITQTASYRFVTDTEKGTWNGKANAANPVMTGLLTLTNSAEVNKMTFLNNAYRNRGIIIGAEIDTAYIQGALSNENNWNLALNPLGGNVGVGITIPQAKVHISHPAAAYNASLTYNAAAALIVDNWGAQIAMGIHDSQVSGSQPFYIQARQAANTAWNLALNPLGGNVAIGTIAATHTLTIQKNAEGGEGAVINLINSQYANSGGSSTSIRFQSAIDTRYSMIRSIQRESGTPDRLSFFVTSYENDTLNEILSIKQNRNVGINIIDPLTNLDVLNPSKSWGESATYAYFGCSEKQRGLLFGQQYNGVQTFAFIQSKYGVTDAHGLLINPDGGNVGINNNNPQQPLHVVGNTPLRLERTGIEKYDFEITNNGTNDILNIASVDQSKTIITFDSSGRVGIMNTTPSEALDVTGNIKASGSIAGASISVTGNATVGGTIIPGKGVRVSSNLIGAYSQDNIFDALADAIPTTGNKLIVNGSIYNTALYVISCIERTGTSTMRIHYQSAANGNYSSLDITNGNLTNYNVSIAW